MDHQLGLRGFRGLLLQWLLFRQFSTSFIEADLFKNSKFSFLLLISLTLSSMISYWYDQSVAQMKGRISYRLSSQLSGSKWKDGGRMVHLWRLMLQKVKNLLIFVASQSTFAQTYLQNILSNIETGPRRYIFRSLPNMQSQAYVNPMSYSSVWATSPAANGRSSAVGVASKTSLMTQNLCKSQKQLRISLNLYFENDPMGLMSDELQSYFVKYPLSDSSRFEEPKTSKKPSRFSFQTSSEARKYVSTILDLDWMFCKAKSVLQEPPSFLYFASMPNSFFDIS